MTRRAARRITRLLRWPSEHGYARGWDQVIERAAADVDDVAKIADKSGSSLVEASDLRILAETLRSEAEH